jgi:hypothetical protein
MKIIAYKKSNSNFILKLDLKKTLQGANCNKYIPNTFFPVPACPSPTYLRSVFPKEPMRVLH